MNKADTTTQRKAKRNRAAKIAKIPHSGAVTHHHDHAMMPVSFRTRNTMKRRNAGLIPEFAFTVFFSDIVSLLKFIILYIMC